VSEGSLPRRACHEEEEDDDDDDANPVYYSVLLEVAGSSRDSASGDQL